MHSLDIVHGDLNAVSFAAKTQAHPTKLRCMYRQTFWSTLVAEHGSQDSRCPSCCLRRMIYSPG
jgi:hypothetical protein